VNRGLLVNLNSEAELAGVLGMRSATSPRAIRRAARLAVLPRRSRNGCGDPHRVGMRLAQLANIGGQAWKMGYGRDNEMKPIASA
jgi:predicted Zn-dependent protease